MITGTAQGFGHSSVRRFAAEGWNLVATVRREADLGAHGGLDCVRTLLLDVDDEAADLGFAAVALQQSGRVDALVDNAGYHHMGPVEAGRLDQVHGQFQTNVFGSTALTRAFLPHFRERWSGVIVNLSSTSADQGYPRTAVCAASKAAVASFADNASGSAPEVRPGGSAARHRTSRRCRRMAP